jgi:O-antigen ligase
MVKYISDYKLINFISFLLGVFVFLPFKLKPLIVFCLLLFVLVNIKRSFNLKPYLWFFTYFFVVAASLTYCNNFEHGFSLLIRFLPFIVIPLFFSILKKDELDLLTKNFIKVFVFSCFFYAVLMLAYMYYIKSTTHLVSLNHLLSYVTNEFFGINEHPIYLSSYISIAIIFLFLNNYRSKIKNFILFFLIVTLILLTRKIFITTLFVIFFLQLFNIKNLNSRNLLLGFIIFFSSSLLVYLVPEISGRFLEVLDYKQNDIESSTGSRISAWKTIIEIFIENWQIGVSWGDTQDRMNLIYAKYGYNEIMNLNAHNQYLQILLSSGIIGFLIISIIYCKLFISNYKQNKYFIYTQIIFLAVFLVENYLERQNGVIFFILITCFFIKKNK